MLKGRNKVFGWRWGGTNFLGKKKNIVYFSLLSIVRVLKRAITKCTLKGFIERLNEGWL